MDNIDLLFHKWIIYNAIYIIPNSRCEWYDGPIYTAL